MLMLARKVQSGRSSKTVITIGQRLLIAGAVAVCLVITGPAQAYRRGRYSYSYGAVRARQQQYLHQAAVAQISAARQVLADAEATGSSAQNKLNASLSKLRDEAQKFREAQSVARHAAKELNEIEAEILDEQKADSPYKLAVKELETARANLKGAEDRILANRTAAAKLSGLEGVSLAEAKAKLFELDGDYLAAKAELNAKGSAVAGLRAELFKADTHWKEANDTLTKARQEESSAEEMTHSGVSGRRGLTSTVKNSSDAAAAARAAIAQAEGVLRATGGSRYLNAAGSTGSRNPGRTFGK